MDIQSFEKVDRVSSKKISLPNPTFETRKPLLPKLRYRKLGIETDDCRLSVVVVDDLTDGRNCLFTENLSESPLTSSIHSMLAFGARHLSQHEKYRNKMGERRTNSRSSTV